MLASATDSSKAGSARLLAQWEEYPLKTADDIKRWAHAKLEEPTKPLEAASGSGADADGDAEELDLGYQDTPEDTGGSSAYGSSYRQGQAVPSPIESVSLEDDTIRLPPEFRDQFIW